MITGSYVFAKDGTHHTTGDVKKDIEASKKGKDSFVWVGLANPTQEEFNDIDAMLHLHPLAVEDAIKGKQRVKVEKYDDTYFVVLRELHYVNAAKELQVTEVMFFANPKMLVTVRHGDIEIEGVMKDRLKQDPKLASYGSLGLFYVAADAIVDDYRLVDDRLDADMQRLEDQVLSSRLKHTNAIYRLRREVLQVRHAVDPLVGPMADLRFEHLTKDEPDGLRLLLRDVEDHLKGISVNAEAYDKLLSDLLSTRLGQISVQQNDDMRKISSYAAVIAIPTLWAGIFGMNFKFMPLISSTYGFAIGMGLMVLGAAGLYVAFRNSKWI